MTFETITPELFRAALGLSGLSLSDFSEKTGISKSRLSKFQNNIGGSITEKTSKKIREFFYNRGVEINKTGVAFTQAFQELYGRDGFRQLYEDIYASVKEGGEIAIYNGVSELFIKGLGQDYVRMHIARMNEIASKIRSRIIVHEGDLVFFGRSYAHYRCMPSDQFSARTMIVYAKKIAFLDIEGDSPYIQLHSSQDMAEMCLKFFDLVWEYQAKEVLQEYSLDNRHNKRA
jgi:transcriptional regulator with XRE-family HTH domain